MKTRREVQTLAALLGLMCLSGCSVLFPNLEAAIFPEGATLEEAGIALAADFESWVDSVLWVLGFFGLM